MTPQQILSLLLEIADLRSERDALRGEVARLRQPPESEAVPTKSRRVPAKRD